MRQDRTVNFPISEKDLEYDTRRKTFQCLLLRSLLLELKMRGKLSEEEYREAVENLPQNL